MRRGSPARLYKNSAASSTSCKTSLAGIAALSTRKNLVGVCLFFLFFCFFATESFTHRSSPTVSNQSINMPPAGRTVRHFHNITRDHTHKSPGLFAQHVALGCLDRQSKCQGTLRQTAHIGRRDSQDHFQIQNQFEPSAAAATFETSPPGSKLKVCDSRQKVFLIGCRIAASYIVSPFCKPPLSPCGGSSSGPVHSPGCLHNRRAAQWIPDW